MTVMRRSLRFRSSVILLLVLICAPLGTATAGYAAPVGIVATGTTIAADSGPVPRFEAAACPWKLPTGQVEGQTVKCGFAVVPEVHQNPTGPTIRLPVAVFKSTASTSAPDATIYLQGGPGAAVGDFITSFLEGHLDRYTAARDLIVFDQRGIGFAQPSLDCPEVTAVDLANVATQTSQTQKTNDDIAGAFACRDRLVKQGIDLGAYTSAEGAADVNDIRAVLGYPQLNLLGVSYGTRLALTIMRDFPNAVRSAVLDSSVPLQTNIIEDNGVNFKRSFDLFFAACAADSVCTTKYPALQADYAATVAQLNAQPIMTTATDQKTNETVPVVVDGIELTSLISVLLYLNSDITRIIPPLVEEVKTGQTTILNVILNAIGPIVGADINVGAYFSVVCSEEVPFNNRDRAAAAAQSLPPDLQEIFASDVRQHFDICAQWPVHAINPVEAQSVTSDLPALVLSSDNDPATPPSYGTQVEQTLSHGFLITFPGIGHSVLGNGGDCGLSTIFTFIDSPTTKPPTDCVGKTG
ncbi:MAG: alpha/beta fold hydrolase [Thermomicrobiales bacterium]